MVEPDPSPEPSASLRARLRSHGPLLALAGIGLVAIAIAGLVLFSGDGRRGEGVGSDLPRVPTAPTTALEDPAPDPPTTTTPAPSEGPSPPAPPAPAPPVPSDGGGGDGNGGGSGSPPGNPPAAPTLELSIAPASVPQGYSLDSASTPRLRWEASGSVTVAVSGPGLSSAARLGDVPVCPVAPEDDACPAATGTYLYTVQLFDYAGGLLIERSVRLEIVEANNASFSAPAG